MSAEVGKGLERVGYGFRKLAVDLIHQNGVVDGGPRRTGIGSGGGLRLENRRMMTVKMAVNREQNAGGQGGAERWTHEQAEAEGTRGALHSGARMRRIAQRRASSRSDTG